MDAMVIGMLVVAQDCSPDGAWLRTKRRGQGFGRLDKTAFKR